MITLEKLISPYYKNLGVTPEMARACLQARIAKDEDATYDDGFNPGYYEACEKISVPEGVYAVVLGDSLYDNLMELAEEL